MLGKEALVDFINFGLNATHPTAFSWLWGYGLDSYYPITALSGAQYLHGKLVEDSLSLYQQDDS